MSNGLFRQSTLDRVSSPDQLNDYIRVTKPGVWLALAAVMLLLSGILVWSIFGTVKTTVRTGVLVTKSGAYAYVAERDAQRLTPGMTVTLGDLSGVLQSVSSAPVRIGDQEDAYLLYLGGFAAGDFCYRADIAIEGAALGAHPADITVDAVHPITFVIH